jgi:RNA polymerase primary sigma factor
MGEKPTRYRQDTTDEIEKRYYHEINRYPLLSAEEEIDLARRVQSGDQNARRTLILANLKLVITIARSFSSYGVPFLDLVEEGNLGLMKAVTRFDPEKGFRFSTYASWWIKQAIVRAIANHSRTIRIPIHVFQLMMKYIALEPQLEQKGLTKEEQASRLGVSRKRYRMIQGLVENVRALDLANSVDALNQLSRSIESEPGIDPEKIILQMMENENLGELMERLSTREKLILRIRYGFDDGEPHTLAETGKVIHVSRERVRQLEMRALRKLKCLLEPANAPRRERDAKEDE